MFYYNDGLGKMTNIKQEFLMDRLILRPALVIFWSATAQNNSPQDNFTAVIKFRKIRNMAVTVRSAKDQKQRAITPTVYMEVVKQGRNHRG